MRLHKRTMPCQKAEIDLRDRLHTWLESHPDLTWSEAVRCMAGIIHGWSAYPVRDERHPDDEDARADEE